MRRSLRRVAAEHRGASSDSTQTVLSFADLFDAHGDAVYRFVYRRCRSHDLAEDITQETFLTALRTVDDPDSVSVGWLVTVARNRLFDVLRRQTNYNQKLRLVGAAGEVDGEVGLEDRLRVEGALAELSIDHRLVLTLHYMDGWSVPEMAERLGRTVKSAEGLVTRARRELRAKLDEETETVDKGGAGHGC